MPTPKIAIVGAGPAGCMLARILSLSNISVTVFESDSSPNYRTQGGTLDLHPTTGIAALKDANLFEDFKKTARYDGDYYCMTDNKAKPFIQMGHGGGSVRPEIDRADLRKILAESLLPEGTIRWGHRLKRVEDGSVLVFEHSTKSGFDLIVGCEGGWSKVRKHITPTQPYYSGIGYTQLSILNPEETVSELYKMVNRGNVFAHNNGEQLAVQQMGDGSLHMSWSAVRDENWMQSYGYDTNELEQARQAILTEMQDWSPLLRGAIEKAQGKCDSKDLYMLPVGWRWEHHRKMTIIGDAAHLMTPFAGEGVNVAFDDARRLAAAIVKATQAGGDADQLNSQVTAFEEEMFVRMERYQRATNDIMKAWMFTPGDIWNVVPDALLCVVKLQIPKIMHPLAYLGMHVWWWVRRNFFV
ncbi:uncharacterized protein BCR38DRAFT_342912 [Pseudomassariella vexata]|uniref:FAD-binding domain-containing protein n=1 Tax=Pseudomassariella vexata TaxID=1141098 RepID=A0A1Y2DZ16_9PEZI|nr:uncharacterized protein BCR38DRAFT_342912 [Pseudomassariella vexata]ORY64334.1 hypothetical protein BCR38DRAFT_342912 [Pseudomassariella vexata]